MGKKRKINREARREYLDFHKSDLHRETIALSVNFASYEVPIIKFFTKLTFIRIRINAINMFLFDLLC